MSKRTTFTTISPLPPGISRQVVLDFLHDHEEMIDLNPLVKERHPIKPPPHCPADESHCSWYSLTDRISYLPGGLASGDITYTCAFHDIPTGVQTHCYAPAGLNIRDKWTLNGYLPDEPPIPVELGIGAPPVGLYIREDVDMKCNMIMTSFVKKTLKKSHAALVERLKEKAQVASASVVTAGDKLNGPSFKRFHSYSQSDSSASSFAGSIRSSPSPTPSRQWTPPPPPSNYSNPSLSTIAAPQGRHSPSPLAYPTQDPSYRKPANSFGSSIPLPYNSRMHSRSQPQLRPESQDGPTSSPHHSRSSSRTNEHQNSSNSSHRDNNNQSPYPERLRVSGHVRELWRPSGHNKSSSHSGINNDGSGDVFVNSRHDYHHPSVTRIITTDTASGSVSPIGHMMNRSGTNHSIGSSVGVSPIAETPYPPPVNTGARRIWMGAGHDGIQEVQHPDYPQLNPYSDDAKTNPLVRVVVQEPSPLEPVPPPPAHVHVPAVHAVHIMGGSLHGSFVAELE
ncbi:hypothetical protein B0T17DRAFT_506234 [Bombardia bombarda]|uniref:DUF7053 domain-containing protein n=1 Tax=Bombardia bombarda TaxID=252184 RepID=A0AA39X9C7_9PEZI|nr:hypothetical protein B0T17DRAFT_506234 [Bombardia bombarda]